LGFQKGLFIDLALRQGLKQPLPNMVGIQTWFELSINYFQNLTIAGSKEDFKSFFPNKAFVIILDPYIK
jgi:hypothetical protein